MIAANTNIILINKNQKNQISLQSAMELADNEGLDLVFCNSASNGLPIYRLTDLKREAYEKKKRNKEGQKKNKIASTIKTVEISPVIGEADFNRQVITARKFLEKGYTVKVSMLFKGRMPRQVGDRVMDRAIAELSDIAIVKSRTYQGKFGIVILK